MAPLISFLLWAFAALNVSAHPGATHEEHLQEAAARRDFLKRNPISVGSCANSEVRRRHINSAIARRRDIAHGLRARRGLVQRDFSSYNFSHASNADISFGDDETSLFADNSSCLLQAEVTQGPYFVDGEIIRSDMRETQSGVPLYLDVQLVDTSTCSPASAIFVEAWHCNASGIYSGVVANGNGDSTDLTNINKTFSRGVQQTDANGVVQFQTIFPGHYTGRATHVHILSHNVDEAIIRTNGTLLSSNTTAHASHVGQLFFDQDLISQVEATSPYSENTQTITTNDDDSILIEETDNSDPFVEYLLINPDDISEGVLAWISVGIDLSSDYEIAPAATYYADGGVTDSSSSGSGGSGGPGGSGGNATNSTAPSSSSNVVM